MFQDEARFGRISDARRCWAKRPCRPVVKKMCVRQYTYAFSAVSPVDGVMDSLVLPGVGVGYMNIFLQEVAVRHPAENIVMVLDGASWHKARQLNVPSNMRLIFLPPYSPELNPVEHIWDDLREKHFHNQTFDSMRAVERRLCIGLRDFESSPDRVQSIVGWDWIINSVFNEK